MTQPSTDNPFLTVDDVAGIFAVTAYTVRGWCKEGKLKARKLPGANNWRILHSDMVDFANGKYGDGSE